MFIPYLRGGGDGSLFFWGVQVQGPDLTLDFTVESGFPELLVGPNGMVLYAGVGKLVHSSSQSLQDKTEQRS